MKTREATFLVSIISAWMGLIAYITLTRNYFGFGTEIDYLGGFLPETQRLLSGEPLALEFHPPLYSVVLSIFQFILDDWFLSGRLLSLCSYLVALVTTYFFFLNLAGKAAGWGALLALMASVPFTYNATITTSDMFFYALYSSTLLFAILAYKNNSHALWTACGVLISLVLLSRTNGFTLMMLLFLPWIANASFRDKRQASFAILVGILIPLIIWVAIARYSGSPLMPSGTYANLALTYFSPSGSKTSGYDRVLLEAQFKDIWEVLAYNPKHIVYSYFHDFYKLVKYIVNSNRFIEFSLSLFLIPGLLLLLLRSEKTILFYLFLITLSQVLLVNFKGFELRLYLFLIPLYGVAIAITIETLLAKTRMGNNINLANSTKAILITAIILTAPIVKTFDRLTSKLLNNDQLLAESVTTTKGLVPEGSDIVAWAPQIPFYLKSRFVRFPLADTYLQLDNELAKNATDKQLYLYYGFHELRLWPQFNDLIRSDAKNFSWLTIIAKSSKPGEWVLYKYNNGHK